MRNSVGARSAGAGSSTLPLMSLYATASIGGRVREIGIFNTTTTAVAIALCRLTTAGTQGSGLTEAAHNPAAPAPSLTAFNTHTVGPTLADLGYRTVLGAAAGAGIIWTFGDEGLVIPIGTGQGIGVYVPTGTGQICDIYFVWDE